MTVPTVDVLLIQSDAQWSRSLQEMLAKTRAWRFCVEHASDLKEGLERLQTDQFDVLLLDLELADSSGLATYLHARVEGPDQAIVVLTGSDDPALHQQALQKGAQDFLVKGQFDHRILERSLRYAVQHRRAEQALSVSEALYQSLVDGLPLNVFRKDLEGRIVFANRRYCEMLGKPLGQLVGKTDADLFPPEFATKYRADDQRVVESGQVLEDVEEHRRRDGSYTYVHVLKAPVRDHHGDIVGVQGMFWDVTARRRAEDALRESDERLNLALTAAEIGTWVWNIESRELIWDERMREIFGVELGEFTSKEDDFWSRVHREDGDRVREAFRATLKSDAVFDLDFRLVLKPRGIRHVEMRARVQRDQQGRPLRMTGVCIDITRRKHAEEQLIHERSLIHSLMNTVPDAIYFKDTASRFIRVNKALAELFHLKDPSEAIGKSDFDFFPKEQALEKYADEQEIMRTGRGVVGKEEADIMPDGTHRWVSTTKMPLRDRDGAINGTFGISRDITTHKQFEQRLEKANQKLQDEIAQRTEVEAALARERDLLRALMDNLPDYIFVKDVGGRFLAANKSVCQLLGVSDESQALGKTDFDFISAELAESYRRDDQRVIESGEPLINHEEKGQAPDGGTRWLLTTKTPLCDQQGNVIGLVGICRDITRRKKFEAALRKAKDDAESANRAKSTFLANMSHEIRTPMNAIMGMTELVLDTELTSLQREYLSVARDSCDSLLTVIDDILDFSKIEAGRLDLDCEPFDLQDLVGDTMKSLAPRAHKKGLELIVRASPHAPREVVGDEHRLRQVLVNLIGNAIKFTERGEVTLRVKRLAGRPKTVELQFSVQDTGLGIEAERRDAIFAAFEQGDASTTRKYGGAGLGLAISSRLVEMMGGRIWVDSNSGQGSTFHFTACFQPHGDAKWSQAGDPAARLEKARVLVVENNASTREAVEEMLSQWGMQTCESESVTEALGLLDQAVADRQPFDLVVADAKMPDGNGLELAESIAANPDVGARVVLLLKATEDAQRLERCDELGVAACLMKPVKQSELFDALATALRPSVGEQAKQIAQAAVPPAKGLNILLAEDSLVNQKLAVGLLERDGHRVIVVDNGKAAVDAVAESDFDMVLMDVQMPEMDGLEATREIRRNEAQGQRHTPIVAMTAHAMKGDRQRCLDAGMDDYLSKPIRIPKLRKVLANVARQGVQDHAGETGEPRSAAADEEKSAQRELPETTETIESSPNGPAAKPAVDWPHAIATVGGDEDLLRELIEIFLKESEPLLDEMKRRLQAHDAKELRRNVHRLKGSLRYFGAATAHDLAFNIERRAADGELAGVAEQLADLQSELDLVWRELRKYLRHPVSQAP